MRKYAGLLMVMMILTMTVVGVWAEEEITVKTMPPSVVNTVPVAGDMAVDPSLREITVTFSKDMMTKDVENHSAVPYLLVFQTASKEASAPDCGNEKAAVAAAEAWLSLVDGGKYGKSWMEAASYFQGAITKDQWEHAIRAARNPLGKNLSRELMSKSCRTSLPGVPDGKYVVIQFRTSFEHKKSAVETITPMMGKDGRWRVSGYYVK